MARSQTHTETNNRQRLVEINRLLDDTIRPHMWDDGGNVELLYLDKQDLHIRFTGACRDCPHADSTTLEAIRSVVRRYDSNLLLINDTHV